MSMDKKKKNDSRKKLWEERKKIGTCVYCGKEKAQTNKIGCSNCLSKKVKQQVNYDKKYKDKQGLYRKRVRRDVVNKYGGACKCCGETELLFLTIDHINNDGHIERKELSNGNNISSTQFFLKLNREVKRDDIQVLCFNCNLGRSMNGGICPHHKPASLKYNLEKDLRCEKKFNLNCKIDWPDDEKLIELCNNSSVTQIAKELGVDVTAVIGRLKRRKKYNLVKKNEQKEASKRKL